MKRRRLVIGGIAAGAVAAMVGVPVVGIVAVSGMNSAAQTACQGDSVSTYTVDALTLDAAQRTNAGTIIAVGAAMTGQQGEIIAVAVALVESGLVNLPHGDADSLGLFQQRASQGWGTPAQEMDPTEASVMFYTALLKIPGWQTLDPGQAAQATQRSAFPDRYDAKMGEAQAIVTAAAPSAAAPSACQQTDTPDGLPAATVAELATASLQVLVAVDYAAAQLGKPYQWGSTGPATFDCSGLTMMAYAAAGIPLTRTTYSQISQGVDVTGGPYQPGDLLFPDPGHVELYIGGGYVIQAPHTGAVVEISPIPVVWQARRIIQPTP